jgi:hypothetical protein
MIVWASTSLSPKRHSLLVKLWHFHRVRMSAQAVPECAVLQALLDNGRVAGTIAMASVTGSTIGGSFT